MNIYYAVHGNTAAEVIVARADHKKEHMGLTSWRNAPEGKIVKADVSVAKNYLSVSEMQELNEIVTMYLDYATRQARRHIPMTMADWASKLDAFLQFNDADILQDKGRVTAEIAKSFAESEFEKYRVIQDRLYQSDFDRLVAGVEEKRVMWMDVHPEGVEAGTLKLVGTQEETIYEWFTKLQDDEAEYEKMAHVASLWGWACVREDCGCVGGERVRGVEGRKRIG